ncbi:MAG: ABC transporter ATP-binding protein [Myxococcales bacterium]|nr:ABC transporter ATP-binding protein [Myxococcales bacterium]
MKTLALEKVTVRFGTLYALSSASVSLEAGQVLMLVGPNGAGKTTLTRVLLGLVRPNAGVVRVDGEVCPINNKFKKSIGYLPEAVSFSDSLSGKQVLRFFARARGVSSKAVPGVLDRVGLKHAAGRSVRGYSKGMRQRLGLAVAIIGEPKLLILDEPTGGLDTEGLSVLWSILAEWREKKRMVFMASHQLAMLERRVDKMGVFLDGKLLACDSPAELRASVGLKQKAVLSLSEDSNDGVEEFVEAVEDWKHGIGKLVGNNLTVHLEEGKLLELMDIRARHPNAVKGIQTQEPTLDMIYERLLEIPA